MADYLKGIAELQSAGFSVRGVVCDGLKGLIPALARNGIPVQLCQFHQVAAVTRYLTRRPGHIASRTLKDLTHRLKDLTAEAFTAALAAWYHEFETYLYERTTHPITGKSSYTHQRLRKAYRSLERQKQWLFTYQQQPQMPNTTNHLEGLFCALKNKLRNHNGLSINRKKQFVDEFFRHRPQIRNRPDN